MNGPIWQVTASGAFYPAAKEKGAPAPGNKGTEQVAVFQQTDIADIRGKGAGSVKLRQHFSAGSVRYFYGFAVTRHEAVDTSLLKRNKVFALRATSCLNCSTLTSSANIIITTSGTSTEQITKDSFSFTGFVSHSRRDARLSQWSQYSLCFSAAAGGAEIIDLPVQ